MRTMSVYVNRKKRKEKTSAWHGGEERKKKLEDRRG